MSKFGTYLSYKDWCILKHALAEKVKTKEEIKAVIGTELSKGRKVLDKNKHSEFLKELEEEKRTLERVTEIVDEIKKHIGKER